MKRIFFTVFFFLTLLNISIAQEEERKIILKPDLHFRTFWMSTNYPGAALKEDYALGSSLHLGAVLSFQKKWKFHFGYRTFANLSSSEIWEADPSTGQVNRYELGLFDLLDPRDSFFGKLENFSFEYSEEKFGIKVGRMGIHSDWVNAQDGRLSPTAIEGINGWFAPDSKWKFTIWGLGRMSIRGSSEWLSVGETVGIYPLGRTISGKPGGYFGNTTSDWIGIWEVDRKIGSDAELHFSNTIAQNLFSTYMFSFQKNQKVDFGIFTLGLQGGFQHGLGEGGNDNPELQYKVPSDRNFSLSGRIGWGNKRWMTHVNFTHVGGNGRWLSPREWGKDAWYTFIPRERNEGFESVNALVGYGEYKFVKAQISIYGHFGFHWLPSVDQPAENKYNFPSYRQMNFGVKYQPKNIQGLDFQLLLMNKVPFKKTELTPNQVYNKVEMLHLNAILNWKWN